MNLKVSIAFLLISMAFVSCDKSRVFDEYKSMPASGWHKDSIVSFDLPQVDSTKTYNLFVNVRDNDKYEFSNLFLIVSMEQPKGIVKLDTLEYQMADPEGNLLGDGFSDIKESKLFYKENYTFKPSGKYHVKIRQAVRKGGKISGVERLDGITDVGFRIESTK
ncbi:gliding motility lipoprotein GldH [Flavobacterium silvaticum]|uniref:Gliding motility lipoprotein GldH n=1 Tax=Flavobacterium silvaticum TaxID=1852020 RepID=A0A972JFT0_9FLAO|nr:gliding motility lipoprotein GldH [Flavobacterium silvaticum]NMH28304.1 gliding motility lipoprotein GldH [Flavobacterium silvaticum]